MASNDKKTLLKRLAGSEGKGLGANTGLGTADIVVPKFPELPETLNPPAIRAWNEEVERWRASMQAQFPVPTTTP